MKKITRMATLGVFLLAGVSGTALANGTSAPEPEPMRYMPPPPPPAPAPAPVVDTCEPGAYISGSIGIGIPEKSNFDGYKYEMETGLALNGAIGYDFGDTRLEAAVGYQKHDFKNYDDDLSLLTVMANAYYDIDTGSDITPYLMAGAGWAHVDSSWDESDDVFAWQVGAGLGFKVADCTTLDLGYRYLRPNKFDLGEGDNTKWAVHNIMLGLRYNF
ncbi:outer membrane protein [Chlorobaculum parvum]|nr:outer membrane beta-barrel protein [Chlorobaculum parvum]